MTRLLHVAVEWDQLASAKFLIDAGAPIEGRNHLGETPLMHAVGYCTICIEMVELLIAAGADADAENNGERVIDYANSADTTNAMQTAALEALWRAAPQSRRFSRNLRVCVGT